ncbi:MAG: MATE family efflux transporter, partial [Niameybacter sp.]
KTGVVLMTILGLIGYLSAPSLMGFFRKGDAEVIAIGVFAIRTQCLVLPLFPLGVISNMTFQMIGKSWQATFMSAFRQGVFFLPLILTLPRFIGLTGIQLTQPVADLLTFFASLPFMIPFLKELNQQIAEIPKAL